MTWMPKPSRPMKSFSTVSSALSGRFVRVAARYQSNGSFVAVRVWSSTSFNSVWLSPEGHVLHVNTTTDTIVVQNELGIGVPLKVDANTEFFYRTPWNAVSDSTPMGTGTSFLTNKNVVRGFKIHASVVDPLASPLVAQSVDIEIARYDGSISAVNPNNFTYTRKFNNAWRRLQLHAAVYLQQFTEWQRSRHGKRHHRLQMVEFHVSHNRGQRRKCDPGLRSGNKRHGELRRHRRSVSDLGRQLRHLERPDSSQHVGRALDGADPYDRAAGHGVHFVFERNFLAVRRQAA